MFTGGSAAQNLPMMLQMRPRSGTEGVDLLVGFAPRPTRRSSDRRPRSSFAEQSSGISASAATNEQPARRRSGLLLRTRCSSDDERAKKDRPSPPLKPIEKAAAAAAAPGGGDDKPREGSKNAGGNINSRAAALERIASGLIASRMTAGGAAPPPGANHSIRTPAAAASVVAEDEAARSLASPRRTFVSCRTAPSWGRGSRDLFSADGHGATEPCFDNCGDEEFRDRINGASLVDEAPPGLSSSSTSCSSANKCAPILRRNPKYTRADMSELSSSFSSIQSAPPALCGGGGGTMAGGGSCHSRFYRTRLVGPGTGIPGRTERSVRFADDQAILEDRRVAERRRQQQQQKEWRRESRRNSRRGDADELLLDWEG